MLLRIACSPNTSAPDRQSLYNTPIHAYFTVACARVSLMPLVLDAKLKEARRAKRLQSMSGTVYGLCIVRSKSSVLLKVYGRLRSRFFWFYKKISYNARHVRRKRHHIIPE